MPKSVDLNNRGKITRVGRFLNSNFSYFLIYLTSSVMAFWPSPPWDATRLPTDYFGKYMFGDPPQMTWFLDWFPYAISHGMNIFYTNFIDYPVGVNLANNTSVPLLGLIASPITLTLGPVTAFNLLLRLAFFSSAVSMFFLLRLWTRPLVAFAGGFLYAFGPYMVTEGQTHLNLVFVPIPPLIVMCVFELLFVRRHSPARVGLLLGALAGAQALIEPELLAMLAIVIFLGVVVFTVLNFKQAVEVIEGLLGAIFSAMAIFLALTGYWMWCLLQGSGHVVGTVLQSRNLEQYRADLLSPIMPTDQLIAPLRLQVASFGYVGGNFTENVSYLTLPLVALVVLFAIVWRRDRVILSSALLAMSAFLLSLGSSLNVNNHQTGIPMPEAVFKHLPILNNFIPARFSFVAALFSIVAVAVGAEHFVRFMGSDNSRRLRKQVIEIGGVLGFALVLILSIPQLPFKTAAPPWPRDTVNALRIIPPGTVVLTYPFTLPERTEAMSWQAQLDMRFRLVGGYATVQGGENYGQQFPRLLSPAFVQEYLTQSQGTLSWTPFYPPFRSNSNQRVLLCSYISKYSVGAVVFWNVGAYPGRVLRLFQDSLGAPIRSTRNDTVKIWLTRTGHCK